MPTKHGWEMTAGTAWQKRESWERMAVEVLCNLVGRLFFFSVCYFFKGFWVWLECLFQVLLIGYVECLALIFRYNAESFACVKDKVYDLCLKF